MFTHTLCLVSSLSLLFAAANVARAEPTDGPTKPRHDVSVTFSPLHLILPVFEVQVEGAVLPKLGVGVVAGFGSITDQDTDESFDVWELGAKGEYYVVGDFDHGMQIGLEALYLRVSTGADSSFSSAVFANGLSLSPFIGYKIAIRVGFTFEAQLGPAFVFATAESSSSSSSANTIVPMLNLNVGWSF